MNNNIRSHIRKRNKLYKKAKSQNTELSWVNFKKARNEVTKLIRKSKSEYHNKIIERLNSDTNIKTWFKLAKQLTGKHQSGTIPTLATNGTYIDSDQDKAEVLNSFFCSQSALDDQNKEPPLLPQPDVVLSSLNITTQAVTDAIKVMDASKASGPDMVSPRLLREGVNTLAAPLAKLLNILLTKSEFPSEWKRANVTPLFKKSDPSDPANYRPISLLSCLGKLMERCVHNHLYNFLVSNSLLSPFQSGFIKGDSTTNQLVYMYNDICSALDQGKVRAVFCDISKAFDRVWHRGLLHKLSSLGIRGSLLNWFSSYLSSRQQRVVFANVASSWRPVTSVVPQGSILGPLLFLVYINDIVNSVASNIRLFADDTSLYIVVDTPDTAAQQLNSDLDKINTWSQIWLVSFNPTKTESITFSSRLRKPQHAQLFFDGVPIKNVSTHKHLGVTLSDDARWKDHVTSSLHKAWQRVGILRSLKFQLNRTSLERMYFSYIRPLLEYSDVVWDNCSNELKNDVEAVQTEAARIVTGATKLCNIHKLMAELGWESLASRRKKHRLLLLYKMVNSNSPQYLSNLIPRPTQARYQLRNLDHIPLVHARTQLYKNSFLPATIRDWNSLPQSVRNSSSLEMFKSAINRSNRHIPPHYHVGTRRGQILHTRLRLGCSSLNHDLHRKSIVDSPLCRCGEIETVKHFLLDCDRYHFLRQSLIANIPCPPTLENFLYGNDRLSVQENKAIFLKVQHFILASARF